MLFNSINHQLKQNSQSNVSFQKKAPSIKFSYAQPQNFQIKIPASKSIPQSPLLIRPKSVHFNYSTNNIPIAKQSKVSLKQMKTPNTRKRKIFSSYQKPNHQSHIYMSSVVYNFGDQPVKKKSFKNIQNLSNSSKDKKRLKKKKIFSQQQSPKRQNIEPLSKRIQSRIQKIQTTQKIRNTPSPIDLTKFSQIKRKSIKKEVPKIEVKNQDIQSKKQIQQNHNIFVTHPGFKEKLDQLKWNNNEEQNKPDLFESRFFDDDESPLLKHKKLSYKDVKFYEDDKNSSKTLKDQLPAINQSKTSFISQIAEKIQLFFKKDQYLAIFLVSFGVLLFLIQLLN